MDKYFYSIDGIKTIGPVSADELKELYRRSAISDFSLVASEGPANRESYYSWFPMFVLERQSKSRPENAPEASNQLGILARYLQALVAVNSTDPSKFEAARLAFVGTDFFTVKLAASNLPVHYPIQSILSLREWPINVPYAIHRPVDLTLKQGALSKMFLGSNEEKQSELMKAELQTPLAIEIYHNVIYSNGGRGSFGVGLAIPIG